MGNENEDVWADLTSGNALQSRYLRGDAVDELLGRLDKSGGSVTGYYTLTDRLGSIRDVIDTSGAVQASVSYDSFGNATVSGSHPEYSGRYGWTGREQDDETGLQYNRGRYYDPATGRWISQDPLRFDAGDANLYRYVGNDPRNWIDPVGFQSFPRGGIAPSKPFYAPGYSPLTGLRIDSTASPAPAPAPAPGPAQKNPYSSSFPGVLLTGLGEVTILFNPAASSLVRSAEKIAIVQTLRIVCEDAAGVSKAIKPGDYKKDNKFLDKVTTPDYWVVDHNEADSKKKNPTPLFGGQYGWYTSKKDPPSKFAKITDPPTPAGGDKGMYVPVKKKEGGRRSSFNSKTLRGVSSEPTRENGTRARPGQLP